MAKGDTVYLVNRVYTDEDRHTNFSASESSYYGWTRSRNVLKAFLQQRNKTKYRAYKVNATDIKFGLNDPKFDYDIMIDMINLPSVKYNGKKFILFMTAREMYDAEKDILRHFESLCDLSKWNFKCNPVKMFLALKDEYIEALNIIGFRPKNIDDMYPSADVYDSFNQTDYVLSVTDDAYDHIYDIVQMYPREQDNHQGLEPLGLKGCKEDDLFTRSIYSLESFVMALRNEIL